MAGEGGGQKLWLALSKPFLLDQLPSQDRGEPTGNAPAPSPLGYGMSSFSFSLSVLRLKQGIRGFCSKVSHSPLLNENSSYLTGAEQSIHTKGTNYFCKTPILMFSADGGAISLYF